MRSPLSVHAVAIKTLKVLGWIAGITLIVLGVGRVLSPTVTIPGGSVVNPTVDSETRAGGALLICFGLAYVWAVRQSPIPAALLRLLAATMALIAVARIISMAIIGMPHPVFTAFTAVEFVAAALTYWYSTMGENRLGGADGRDR
jgi:cytochrome c biogenesis protein CcdA